MADKPKFNPNKPFEVADQSAKPAFDPNKPFEAAPEVQEKPWYSMSPGGIARGANDALPALGAMGGGMLGLMSPMPGGAFVGAGAGGVAGESLKKFIEQKFFDAPPETREKLYTDLLAAGAGGVVGEGVGELIAGPIASSFAKSGIKDVSQAYGRPGANVVRGAAQRMGVKPTQGMLTDDYVASNLENSLSQSPSIPGALVRSEQKPIFNALDTTSKKAMSEASVQSDVQAGRNIKKGVGDYLEQRYEPIKESYQDIEGQTSKVPLNPKGLDRISKNIRGLDEAKFSGSDGHKIANQFADWLKQAESVNDIKILKTKARQIAQDPNTSFEAKSVASSIMGKLEQAQTNSITRQAVKIAKAETPVTPFRPAPDASESFSFLKPAKDAIADESASLAEGAKDIKRAEAKGKKTGRELIGKIKDTNREYRGLMEDVKKIGKGSGLTKGNKGMAATLNDIETANPQDAAHALFDSGNIEFTSFVKEKMPKQFEMARQQRIAEIAQKVNDDPIKLNKIIEKMGPEEKELLFGKELMQRLEDSGILIRSMPKKVGASDTPRGLSFKDVINPIQNINDLGRYGLLKGKKYSPKIGNALRGGKPAYQGLINKGLIND